MQLRPWSYRLRKKMTPAIRKRIKKSTSPVKVYYDKNGRKRVCKTQIPRFHIATDLKPNRLGTRTFFGPSSIPQPGSELRCGKPKQLKATQVYPKGYGKVICREHKSWMDSFLQIAQFEPPQLSIAIPSMMSPCTDFKGKHRPGRRIYLGFMDGVDKTWYTW